MKLKKKTFTETFKFLKRKSIHTRVYDLVNRFKDNRQSIENDAKRDRPKMSIMDNNIDMLVKYWIRIRKLPEYHREILFWRKDTAAQQFKDQTHRTRFVATASDFLPRQEGVQLYLAIFHHPSQTEDDLSLQTNLNRDDRQ